MKSLYLLLFVTINSWASGPTAPTGLILKPYVDVAYRCNWLEGRSLESLLNTNDVQEATRQGESLLGQKITVTCVRAVYRCVHRQDVEPKLVSKTEEEMEMTVVGGAILDPVTKREVSRTSERWYHKDLRPQPRCN